MPSAIVISAAKNGHINQCHALCQAAGWTVIETCTLAGAARYDPLIKKLKIWVQEPAAVRNVLAQLRHRQADYIVLSGQVTRSIAAKLANSNAPKIFVGIPKGNRKLFDFAISFAHEAEDGQFGRPDAYAASAHTIWMRGVPCAPVQRRLETGETAILLGGSNNAFTFNSSDILMQIQRLANQNHPLAIAFSRRTPIELEEILRRQFPMARFINRTSRNDYLDLVATASRFAITPDSITMTCEAATTGKPVGLFELPAIHSSNSTYRFASQFRQAGFASVLPDDANWPATLKWNDTGSAVTSLKEAIASRHM